MVRSTIKAASIAVVALLSLGLGGCASSVALQPAADAVNPACADVIVRLPDTVADLDRRETNAQATGAWGDPADVLLICGVPVPPPTATFPCITVDGINWLRDSTDDPTFIFTTYGRDPAIQVVINGDTVSGGPALSDLSSAVSMIPATRECVALDETDSPEDPATATPTPTPAPSETPAQ